MTRPVTFFHAMLPILFLAFLIGYGLMLRPLALDLPPIPLEIVFICAAAFAGAHQAWLGYAWADMQKSIVNKLASALPGLFILFTIGMIISGWMISGTIPMLVYYGIKWIDPAYLYFLAFLLPVIFSSLTGTSWGSAGTIGVVVMGIASVLGARLDITAAAIIGGAYFGDKMSPLSDTTNMASLAAEVDLFDHIRSMTYTTLPSALLAAILYLALGWIYPPTVHAAGLGEVQPFLESLQGLFHFNVLLLLPPLIVLAGSFRKMPTVPVLIASIAAAGVLTLIFQPYSFTDLIQSLYKGFDVAMAGVAVPERVAVLVNRGGLYALSEAIIIAVMVFIYIGLLDHIRAMPIVVARLFGFARSRASLVISTLFATAFTNAMTSNQYATSFIVGDAFKSRFDELGISRKVLSRSLEDTGTMLESLVPWHATAVFMVATLGVPVAEYWPWQFLSLINFAVAPLLAVTGIGCFVGEERLANS
nr:Na+/H+ antiporter NhaC [Calditrichia bacterium]